MKINTYRIKQFAARPITVVTVDGVPVVSARGKKTISDIISYLEGYDVNITDGKIKRALDIAIEKSKKEVTV